MEIVTIAYVVLHRLASAQGRGFGRHKSIEITKEVVDDSPETLRKLAVSIAEKNGPRWIAPARYPLIPELCSSDC
ncbi:MULTISPECIES: hypothetical protein [Pseudomonas]|uniref:Uncharacterized protein n=1 Tax=Pseudomonas baetica TaxID=674054 RepID=A0ABX4Q7J6_9PSED|nr:MULTISPECIES: hypothetical protein [Pseudomonas]MDR9862299.1 hypothetical protein [Pseudomonas baetica]PKA72784.1 hypothetical protein ATI02_5874 [Pseudomonas baetica]